MSDAGDPPGPLPAGSPRGALVATVEAGLVSLPRGGRALVALSGGPDSTALAYLAAEARPDLGLVLVHVRHGLRDDAEDQDVVATHADWLGLPLVVRGVEVRPGRHGRAAAAREARYAALRTVADEEGAEALLLGHTADDQAETLLQRLARGTGLDGLAGMRPRAGDLLRPLLGIRRVDVHRFVRCEGLPSVDDPGNRDPRAGRTRVRHTVLPALGDVAPDPVGALTRLAELAETDADALEQWAARVAGTARRLGPVSVLAAEELLGAPTAVARRALRHLVIAHTGRPPAAATVARLASLAPGEAVDLPGGVRATFAAGRLALAPRRLPEAAPVGLRADGEAVWPPAGVAVRWHGPSTDPAATRGQLAFSLAGAWTPPEVAIDPAVVPPGGRSDRARLVLPERVPGLWLRHRRPGDRLTLPAGRRRLKDLLIDVGLPRPLRAVWPLVVDADDRLVWVPGLAADEDWLRAGRRRPGGLLQLAPVTRE